MMMRCYSHVSGITLLGFPAETYEFGAQFVMSVFGTSLLVYVTNVFCIPVFHTLQLKSVFEVSILGCSVAPDRIIWASDARV